jgi:hypothetical protein
MFRNTHVVELTLYISGVGRAEFSQRERHRDVSHLLRGMDVLDGACMY